MKSVERMMVRSPEDEWMMSMGDTASCWLNHRRRGWLGGPARPSSSRVSGVLSHAVNKTAPDCMGTVEPVPERDRNPVATVEP